MRNNLAGQMQVAPLPGDDKGLRRAEIRQGVREVILCKDQDGKMGLRVRSVNKVGANVQPEPPRSNVLKNLRQVLGLTVDQEICSGLKRNLCAV